MEILDASVGLKLGSERDCISTTYASFDEDFRHTGARRSFRFHRVGIARSLDAHLFAP